MYNLKEISKSLMILCGVVSLSVVIMALTIALTAYFLKVLGL